MINGKTDKRHAKPKNQSIAYTIFVRQSFQDVLTQIFSADHRANNDHEKGENHCLIKAQHDMWKGKRHFNFYPPL